MERQDTEGAMGLYLSGFTVKNRTLRKKALQTKATVTGKHLGAWVGVGGAEYLCAYKSGGKKPITHIRRRKYLGGREGGICVGTPNQGQRNGRNESPLIIFRRSKQWRGREKEWRSELQDSRHWKKGLGFENLAVNGEKWGKKKNPEHPISH